ncbi:hypothetical protein GIB67_015615 [Kingdonia uniflora]|uniref:SP-RING-type domain-containing protein n=1 Tax=Kingdonia uniflora TaxID=39325 RepID=A0A7J7NU78_9MAGN|nr:hypothetical protein GIB67_015615 [Kingdonia uniflora]
MAISFSRTLSKVEKIYNADLKFNKDLGDGFRCIDRGNNGSAGNVSGDWRDNEQHSAGQLNRVRLPYVPPRPQKSPTPQGPRYAGHGSQQRQWASGNGFSTENRYWDDSDQSGHGDRYGFHERRGRGRGNVPNNFGARSRTDNYQPNGGIGATRCGKQPQYGTQGYSYQGNPESQVANAIISVFQNLNSDVKINVPDFDGKSYADGFIDWLNKHVHHAGQPMPGEEQEDMVMTSTQSSLLNIVCPMTGKSVFELTAPVRSMDCKHIYEKEAVMPYIRSKNNQARCPQTGCPKILQAGRVVCDPLLPIEIDEMRSMANQTEQLNVIEDFTEQEED